MPNDNNMLSEIIVGAVGGFVAGLAVWGAGILKEEWLKCRDKKSVYELLSRNVEKDVPKKEWRSARTIASHTNLPVDRVIYICSIHKEIVPNVGENETVFILKALSNRKQP